MSCQQVPQITEDPYTFTETTTVASTLFNPQIHKLSPITSTIGTPVSVQKQLSSSKSQILTHTRIGPTLQISQQQQQQQHQQIITARINGTSQIVNGLHKTISSATTGNIINKCQSHIQYSPVKVTTTTVSANRRFLPPPSPVTPSVQQTSNLPQYSLAKQPQIFSTATVPIAATATLPPLFQRNVLVTQTGAIAPPQAEITRNPQKNHSIPFKQQTFMGIRAPQQTITMGGSSGGYIHQVIGSVPAIPLNIARKPFPIGKVNVPVTIPTLVTTELKTPADNDKRKLINSEKNVFATPAKRDARVLSSSGKKTRVASSSNIKTKRSYSQTSHHEVLQRIPSSTSLSGSTAVAEWHAPDSYIFDNVSPFSLLFNRENCDNIEITPCVQSHWLDIADIVRFIPSSTALSREQRIEIRKAQLRRQAMQYFLAQPFRTQTNARRRLICVSKTLKKLKSKDESLPPKKCCFPNCSNTALALTAYCYLHITRNTDQFLFLPCTAKFSDNSQCRIPVFDISHELPLCREHAWKRDNYNRIVQEQKPKKPPRKRPKPSAMTRPQKRNKKKRKMLTTTTAGTTGTTDMTNGTLNKSEFNQIKSMNEISYTNPQLMDNLGSNTISNTQDALNICENSSAYESSEDTGVGGLSESELIVGAHDVIEEIPLGDTRLLEEHDLTNVLNQLPVDAFNELFTTVQQNGPLEPTQEEQEDLERALEAVNKQVKSLQQMTGSDSNFLGDFLDVDDQILDDPDICSEVLHSSDTSGIDTSNILVDGGSNSTGSCSTTTNTTEIRELVQT